MKFRRACTTVLACLALVAIPAPAVFAQVSPQRHLTDLQRGLAYYQGKTVIFIAQGAAGGTLDVWARAMTPYLSNYLGANVEVQDDVAGNGVQAQDAIAGAQPNGLTIGWFNVPGYVDDVLTDTPGLNFNPVREDLLGASGANISAWIANPKDYTSWVQVVAPPKPPTVLDNLSGGSNFSVRTTLGILGVHPSLITGYQNNAAIIAGFVRGDGALALLGISDDVPLIKGGVAKPLMLLDPLPKGSGAARYFSGVPTFAQILKKYPPKTKSQQRAAVAALDLVTHLSSPILGAPTATPSYLTTTLRAAFKWAATNKNCIAGLLNDGLTPGYTPGATVKADFVEALKLANSLTGYLR